jgi:hypothetical protein
MRWVSLPLNPSYCLFYASPAPSKDRGKVPPFMEHAHNLNITTLNTVKDGVCGVWRNECRTQAGAQFVSNSPRQMGFS